MVLCMVNIVAISNDGAIFNIITFYKVLLTSFKLGSKAKDQPNNPMNCLSTHQRKFSAFTYN